MNVKVALTPCGGRSVGSSRWRRRFNVCLVASYFSSAAEKLFLHHHDLGGGGASRGLRRSPVPPDALDLVDASTPSTTSHP